MEKSKITTISIILLIFLYILLGQLQLYKLGDTYTYIINPAFWIILMAVLRTIFTPTYNVKRFKKEILEYVFITILIYVAVSFISGIFVGFGNNPYATSAYGIFLNFLTSGTVIIAREYIRYLLIHNVYQKDKKLICILTIILFTLIEFNIIVFLSQKLNGYIIFKQLFYNIIPLVLKNMLFTYVTYKSDYSATIAYDLSKKLFLWVSPILPKGPWVLDAIIETVFPIILLLYIKYAVDKKSRFKIERKIGENSNPVGLIPLSILLILVIWFALGIFPIRPVAVATRKYGA